MTDKPTCETCRFFAKGAGGRGHEAMTTLMVATGNRYYPSSSDVATMMQTDKHGQCRHGPEGLAKWKSDWCGQHTPLNG
jgi:hypothetical protein